MCTIDIFSSVFCHLCWSQEKKYRLKKPFLSSGENILRMGIEFPSQISRELDSKGSTSKPDHTGFLRDMQLASPSCVPCKAGQACREGGSGGEPGRMAYEEVWELTWEGHGMDMHQIWVPSTLGSLGLRLPMSNLNWSNELRSGAVPAS